VLNTASRNRIGPRLLHRILCRFSCFSRTSKRIQSLLVHDLFRRFSALRRTTTASDRKKTPAEGHEQAPRVEWLPDMDSNHD
jgi:hypothetical protein